MPATLISYVLTSPEAFNVPQATNNRADNPAIFMQQEMAFAGLAVDVRDTMCFTLCFQQRTQRS